MAKFIWILPYSVALVEIATMSCYGQPCLLNQTNTCLDNCPRGYRSFPDCNECVDSRLDPLYNCSKCKSTEGNCHMGNFTLSVLFHSYINENHFCGECREQEFGRVCCDNVNETSNCSSDCEVRIMVSVEAFQSLPRNVNLQPHTPDFTTDYISNFEHGPAVFNYSNVSNPFEVQIQTWTERFQFYIVMYDFYNVNTHQRGLAVVDRFLINIDLGPPPASLSRKAYYGIYNISSFDFSFSVWCNTHFYGPECNASSFSEDNGSHDDIGTRGCQNGSCNSINCSYCKLSSSSLQDNVSTLPENVGSTGYIYGAIGGLVLFLLLIAFCLCCVVILRRVSYKRKATLNEAKNADASSSAGSDGYEIMTDGNKDGEIVVETEHEYEYIRRPSKYIKPREDHEYSFM